MAKKRNTPSGGGKRPSLSAPNSRYDVGYGKPPKRTQFKKGISGNPKGRRRKELPAYDPAKGFSNVFLELVSVRQGDKRVKMPLIELLARTLSRKALEGNERAALTTIKIMKELDILRPRPGVRLDSKALKMLTTPELEALTAILEKILNDQKKGNKDADSDDNVEFELG